MPKITGHEEYVYVWTLGVEKMGDGQDKLVERGSGQILQDILQPDENLEQQKNILKNLIKHIQINHYKHGHKERKMIIIIGFLFMITLTIGLPLK